ncbi:MAG TPA: hypothetical protein VHH34_22880 [Pseudonocardiaceae bacterium]|nr:hypothetical protein [Pseudonocardiaceae bacterium]
MSEAHAVAMPDHGSGDQIGRLYTDRVEVQRELIVTCDPATHTMGDAVHAYVTQRVAHTLLSRAYADRTPIEVHGVYPHHLDRVVPGAVRLPADRLASPGKFYNTVRPLYYRAPREDGRGTRLIVAVPPGHDYVMHYASLVGHHTTVHGPGRDALHRVVRYPVAEHSLAEWTGLAHFLGAGDRVLIGYAQQLVPLLVATGARIVHESANAYYGAVRLRFPGDEQVCALGVRFSFWGCMSARLAEACRRLGAREIIYAGKLGALTDPGDLYRRLFVPSGYVHFESPPRLLDPAQCPPNPLLERYPELDSGVHMSVGTVLEEDVQQRSHARRFAVTSIDNEISQIAAALANTTDGPCTGFSAIHFATDYLRDRNEPGTRDVFNLTNHRCRNALERRHAMLRMVAQRLAGHYSNRPAPTRTGLDWPGSKPSFTQDGTA